ncbi:hypothetical protein Mal52_35780 [Symmachiella dynata]|uniref:Uncharacterized protein n=1 Tax=Symmachiella dynata TaxID=2527995 RepID=A0A517ZRI6_9PLAN|nr:hypothetical protein Mal52_35780 [Symmachiella dynata]
MQSQLPHKHPTTSLNANETTEKRWLLTISTTTWRTYDFPAAYKQLNVDRVFALLVLSRFIGHNVETPNNSHRFLRFSK